MTGHCSAETSGYLLCQDPTAPPGCRDTCVSGIGQVCQLLATSVDTGSISTLRLVHYCHAVHGVHIMYMLLVPDDADDACLLQPSCMYEC